VNVSPVGWPALTIAIPTLNRAHLVMRAIESALLQTTSDVEIIVSDNGSTDQTAGVLSEYRASNLRVVRHDRTLSATEHGNFLIDQARGRFFIGLSDDDYLEPDFAIRVIEFLERHPALSFVYTGCTVHYGSVAVPALTGPEIESGFDFIAAYFSGKREVCWCACVSRVADLRSIGPIPEGRIFGDMFYWTRLALNGSVGCVAVPLSHYTFMTTDNLSSSIPVRNWAHETRMIVNEVLVAYSRICTDPRQMTALRQNCASFVARSTANQFVWNAIRGREKRALLRDVTECLSYYAVDFQVWPRLLSALLIPRSLLSKLVLKAAIRRAHLRDREFRLATEDTSAV